MRSIAEIGAAFVGCAVLSLLAGSLAAAPKSKGPERSRSDTRAQDQQKEEPVRWFMIEAGPIMNRQGGGNKMMELCRKAHDAGYNGLLLWDRNLWEKDFSDYYMENAKILKAGLKEIKFNLMVEMAPQGSYLIRWSGDPSICEPRPTNPTPEERDYRYLCLAHPGVLPIWEEQLQRAKRIYDPDGWLLHYDEIRVAGSDARCKASGKSPAQLLAEHTRQAVAMCRRVSPGKTVAVWNDMYDPHHNAKKTAYYHVKQGWHGTWDAIDPEVLILNWNDVIASYDFWSKRGNRQIMCGFYDGELGEAKEAALAHQARQRPGVVGYMYTTWKANFTALRPYLSLSGFGDEPPTVRVPRGESKIRFEEKSEGRK